VIIVCSNLENLSRSRANRLQALIFFSRSNRRSSVSDVCKAHAQSHDAHRMYLPQMSPCPWSRTGKGLMFVSGLLASYRCEFAAGVKQLRRDVLVADLGHSPWLR
jgi:hypothetical protein